jgi:predicted DNA-binding antitoxin AbrB/MazE fold protein
MVQSILAKFDGGVIVPDEPLALQPGQRLRVAIETIEASEPRFAELLELEADISDAPSDLASQHDHYLYGTPKR